MIALICQITEAADGIAKISNGRSDLFVFALLSFGLVAFAVWQNHTQRKATDEREQKNFEFYRDMAIRNSDQMDVNNGSVERVAHAIESICDSHRVVSESVASLHRQQLRDRRSICNVIDATDAFHRGEAEEAHEQLRHARKHILAGETYEPPTNQQGS